MPRTRVALLGIIGLAVLLRCASAILQGDVVQALPGITDQISYDTLARRVLDGFGFTFPEYWWPATRAGEPTAHWSFLYTLYLTAVYQIVGPHPLVARLIQAIVVGVLYPIVTWRLGTRLLGQSVGLAAAAITAVYGYFVYYGGALMTESFYILAVLWSLDLATSMPHLRAHARLWRWLLLGIALSAAVLLRQLMLLVVPFLFVWLAWVLAARPWRGSRAALDRFKPVLLGMTVCALVLVVSIAPWTIRNYTAFHRFVLLNTNAGYAFFWANHPSQGTDFIPIMSNSEYQAMIPNELRYLDEAGLEAALLQRGVGFVVADPGRYLLLSVSRIKAYFEFWPSDQSGALSNVARVTSFGIYFPLMLYGLFVIITRRSVIARGQRPAVLLLCAFGAIYSLIHLLSWALVRYRLPLDAAFMPIASLGMLDLVTRIRALGHLSVVSRASTSSLGEPERL